MIFSWTRKGKSRIIYIVIIVATVSTILVTWYFQNKIEESLPAIASLAAAGFIGTFLYYHQSQASVDLWVERHSELTNRTSIYHSDRRLKCAIGLAQWSKTKHVIT